MHKPNKRHFNKIGQYQINKILNELAEYDELYISDHESSLLLKVFIDEQRAKHNLKGGEK